MLPVRSGLWTNDDRNDSRLYLMGHRHYAADLGRFISRDPIGFRGGLNLFNGAGTSPVTFMDPAGSEPISRLDRAMNQVQSLLSPIPAGAQYMAGLGITGGMVGALKLAGVDFQWVDNLGGDAETGSYPNGQIYMKVLVEAGDCPTDRAVTIMHETFHVFNQKRIREAIKRYNDTSGAFGNPPEVNFVDEVRAYKFQGIASMCLIPADDFDQRRGRRIVASFFGGTPVAEQIQAVPLYKGWFEQSQSLKATQGSR